MEIKNTQKETNQPKEMIPDFIRTERGRSGKENSETSPRKLDVTVLNKKMPIEQVEKGVNHSGLESDQRFQIPDWMIGGVVCFSLIAIKFLFSCDSSFQYHPQVPVQRMIVSSKKNEKQSM